MERIYLIGPVTGIEGGNRAAFEQAKAELNEAGHLARTPFDVVPQDERSERWEFCMRHSLRHIIKEWDFEGDPPAFRIGLLEGWASSEGASIEYELASSLGIPCLPYRRWL